MVGDIYFPYSYPCFSSSPAILGRLKKEKEENKNKSTTKLYWVDLILRTLLFYPQKKNMLMEISEQLIDFWLVIKTKGFAIWANRSFRARIYGVIGSENQINLSVIFSYGFYSYTVRAPTNIQIELADVFQSLTLSHFNQQSL